MHLPPVGHVAVATGVDKHTSLRLYTLTLCVFAIGVAEFLLVGLLPKVASGVGVSVSEAGSLVTAYALAIAIGSPLLIVAVGRFDTRWALVALMGLFSVGNLIVGLSPAFGGLLVGRIASGAAHGAVVAIGASVAASLVRGEREGRAVATVLLGLTAAMVLGVPVGNGLGAAIGWRGTFLVVAGVGLIGLLAVLAWIPSMPAKDHVTGLRTQLDALRNRPLLVSYAVTALSFGASFAVFPYLTPLLHEHAGFGTTQITWLLVLFGGATVAGNLAGGRLSDRLGTLRTTSIGLLGVTVSLVGLTLTANNPFGVAVNLAVWGFFAFMIAPAVQTSVMRVAESYGGELVKVAGGLNVSAFNVGIALASYAGALVLGSFDVIRTPWVGIAFAVAGFGVIAVTRVSRPHARSETLPESV
jgi:DHA1 family inner membrane transport protein